MWRTAIDNDVVILYFGLFGALKLAKAMLLFTLAILKLAYATLK